MICTRNSISHSQKRYKDASRVVDDMEITPFQGKTEIEALTRIDIVVSGLTRERKHLEAIRTEKKGRELQHSRFFKKRKCRYWRMYAASSKFTL